jgi:hypothetical protein
VNPKTAKKKVCHVEDKTTIEPSNNVNTFEQHQTDYIYQCSIIQLKKLLKNELISMTEYRQIAREIRKELCPYLHELYPS